MLFVTDSVQLLQQVPYQGSHLRIWRLQKKWTSNLCCVICNDLVLLSEEEVVVLQGMIHRLIEIVSWYGTEMIVEKTKVMRISRHPSPLRSTVDQKQLEDVEYLNFLG